MTIEHTLRNVGAKPIETNVYNHGFFMLDSQPTGPDFTVKFVFDAKPAREMAGLAEVRGREIVYLKELQETTANPATAAAATAPTPAAGQGRNGRQQASTLIEGFRADTKDFDIRIENRKTGAGIRITADRPLSRLNFWSIRTTVCPETYVDLSVAPGQETQWRLVYDFYSLPEDARR